MDFPKNFKTEIKTFLLVGFIAVVISVGGILLLRSLTQQTPLPPPQPSDTSDFTLSEVEGWQTYRNEKFNFALELPSGYELDGPHSDTSSEFFYIRKLNYVPDAYLTIYKVGSDIAWYGPVTSEKDILINGISGKEIVFTSIDHFSGKESPCYVYEFTTSSYIYQFAGYESCFEGDTALKILSTFRFMEAGSLNSLGYTLVSPDGFSLQIYEEGKVYARISKTQIENEFKKKYPSSLMYDGDRYLGRPPSFFWDQKRMYLIFPISLGPKPSGSTSTWDFFVFAIDSKKFFIIPGGESMPRMSSTPVTFRESPDGDKLAYITGWGGGTCMWRFYPAVLDLTTFKSLNLDESGIEIAKDKNPQIRAFPQDVEEIQWISSDKILAFMSFGCNDPATNVEEKVIFQIIE